MNTTNTPTPTYTIIQRPLSSVPQTPTSITHVMATIPHQPSYRAPTDRIFYLVHTCQPACLNRVRPAKPDIHQGKNPLLTPLLYDFRRMTGRRKVNRKVNGKSNMTEGNIAFYSITSFILAFKHNYNYSFYISTHRCPSM